MAQYKIDVFKAINQYSDDSILNVAEATDMRNVDIEDGVLKRSNGALMAYPYVLPNRAGTIMAYYYNASDREIIVAALDRLYLLGVSSATEIANSIFHTNPTLADKLDHFEFVNFLVDGNDALIYTNGTDNVKSYRYVSGVLTLRDLKHDGKASVEGAGNKAPIGDFMAMHYGRVWVAKKNTLYFSTSNADGFDPDDWTIPVSPVTEVNQHGGFIEMPTYDGGQIRGIYNIFDDVVVFKDRNMFKVVGTYPGEYEVKRIFSANGAIASRSIAVCEDAAYFLDDDGIYEYNGSAVNKISHQIKDIITTINRSYMRWAVGTIYKNYYILAIPTGASTTNNLVIEYNMVKKEYTLRDGFNVVSFLQVDGDLLFSDTTGRILKYNTGGDIENAAVHNPINAYWENGFSDMGLKNAIKRTDNMYFVGKGDGDVKISIITDKSTKYKVVTLTGTEKVYRVKIKNKGRILKVRFENVSGSYFEIKRPDLSVEIDYD